MICHYYYYHTEYFAR